MKRIIYAAMLLLGLSIMGCQKEEPKPEPVKVTAVTLNTTSATLVEGETLEIVATISPSNADNKKILWSTSNSSIATVNEGKVTAIKAGTATITATSDDGGFVGVCEVCVKAPFIIVDKQKCVDLGLSVLWAYCNLGADTPEEFGDFFAWGEIEPKSLFTINNYKYWGVTDEIIDGGRTTTYYGYTKYCTNGRKYTDRHDIIDGKTTLEMSDDAVRHYYKGSWRMPTSEEWNELHKNCTWTWTTLNSVSGYLVQGNNGNQIFLPNAGLKYGDVYYTEWSRYWTSSLDMNAPGNYAAYSSWLMDWRHLLSKDGGGYDLREYGSCIRGVINR